MALYTVPMDPTPPSCSSHFQSGPSSITKLQITSVKNIDSHCNIRNLILFFIMKKKYRLDTLSLGTCLALQSSPLLLNHLQGILVHHRRRHGKFRRARDCSLRVIRYPIQHILIHLLKWKYLNYVNGSYSYM